MTDIDSILDCVPRESEGDLEAYFDRLWPLLRSITGEGVRRTHEILAELLPLQRIEIPTGSQCLDWQIPKEWKVREAYVIDPTGKRILDVHDNNLHLLNYSVSFRGVVSRAELDAHLHSLPELPDAVPYATSYYQPNWGFCINDNHRRVLSEGSYQVVIDTEHFDGSLTISEAVLRGRESAEVLISTYTCHPSLANNELSGPLAAAFLYRRLAALPDRRLTYRFVFLPETIGSIAYLSRLGSHLMQHLVAGYVVTCVASPQQLTYQRSRRGNTVADRAAEYVLSRLAVPSDRVSDFVPFNSDERQYCSPGFNLPVGVLSRGLTDYPEYHTSLDNKDAISFTTLRETIDAYYLVCSVLENNIVVRNRLPYGEPQLGRRGVYHFVGGHRESGEYVKSMLWLLNQATGEVDLLAIAEKSSIDLWTLASTAMICRSADIIELVGESIIATTAARA